MRAPAEVVVTRLDRAGMQPWLHALDAWLLDGSFYGVAQTWPQLYRSDGDGTFFGVFDGEGLVSHCAASRVVLTTADGPRTACLIGSVATAPEHRGQGLAAAVLRQALAAHADAELFLLWAERPELYRAQGFRDGALERLLVLARRPRARIDGTVEGTVRLATVADHAQLFTLHQQKPLRVERSPRTMSTLLSTPGMQTVVLERDGRIAAYACCGKGADLQGHWHELGGTDHDLATLLPAAMHTTEQLEGAVLLPPYRERLAALLAPSVVADVEVHGPMVRAAGVVPRLFVDGLDSV
jgi:GNAT superfamily N-acetyltransferase